VVVHLVKMKLFQCNDGDDYEDIQKKITSECSDIGLMSMEELC